METPFVFLLSSFCLPFSVLGAHILIVLITSFRRQREWTVECYHKTMDRVVLDPTSKWCWNLSGAVDDIRLAFTVGFQLISSPNLWPNWKEYSEFKKIRESQ